MAENDTLLAKYVELKQLEQQEISDGVAQVESHTHIVTVRFD